MNRPFRQSARHHASCPDAFQTRARDLTVTISVEARYGAGIKVPGHPLETE
jgi:hypothetical protein